METREIIALAIILTFLLVWIPVMFRDEIRVKRQIRKELKKRGYELVEWKPRHIDNSFDDRNGYVRYDLRYKNKEGFRRDVAVIKPGPFAKLDFSDFPEDEPNRLNK